MKNTVYIHVSSIICIELQCTTLLCSLIVLVQDWFFENPSVNVQFQFENICNDKLLVKNADLANKTVELQLVNAQLDTVNDKTVTLELGEYLFFVYTNK